MNRRGLNGKGQQYPGHDTVLGRFFNGHRGVSASIFIFMAMPVLLCVDAFGHDGGIRVPKDVNVSLADLFPGHENYFQRYLGGFPDNTQVAVALIRKRSVRYFGIQKRAGELAAVKNADSVFEAGSITKLFTASLLADLVISGQIRQDEAIQDKLDIRLKGHPGITYRQLANHTSGLPFLPPSIYWKAVFGFLDNPFKKYSTDDLKTGLQTKLSLDSEPGTAYQYSNLGYGLLGYLVAEIEGASYEDMLQKRIFTRYRMKNTTTVRSNVKNRLVTGLDKKGRHAENWDFLALAGAGAVLSTVEDLAKFGMAQFDKQNKALALTRSPTFKVPEPFELGENKFGLDIGLGWHILTDSAGRIWHWHNGGTNGYHSSMALDVENEKGVVILSNVSSYNSKTLNIENLLFTLMRSQDEVDRISD